MEIVGHRGSWGDFPGKGVGSCGFGGGGGGPAFGGRGGGPGRGYGGGPRVHGPGYGIGSRGPDPGPGFFYGGGGPGPGYGGGGGHGPGYGGGGDGRGYGSETGGGNHGPEGVTRTLRDEPPSDRILTITNFSEIKGREEPYESAVFEALLSYKWRLILYVNGNQNDGGSNHISLYLRSEETDHLTYNGSINFVLKLFVYNGKQDKYLTVTDGIQKRYNYKNKEWGYGKLIPLSTFLDTSQGYLEQDTASFGAEIFLCPPIQVQEKVTFISNPPNNVFTWKILHFSTLEDIVYYSDDFLVEDRYWRLGVNPKGTGDGRSQAIKIFLYAQGHKPNAVVSSTWGAVNLRVKNQRSSNHSQIYSAALYPIRNDYGVGVNTVLSLAELNDAVKEYLVNDSIIFEAEMVKVSVTNIVPIQVVDE